MATTTIIGNVITAVKNNIDTIKAAIGNATASANGLMSSTDKSKLNGIAEGATKTTITNNLTTTATGTALDAAQGYALKNGITSGSVIAEYANAFACRGTNVAWEAHEGMYYYEGGDTTELNIPYSHCFVLHFQQKDGNTNRGVAIALRWASLGTYATATTIWVNGDHNGWAGWRALN